MCTHSWWTLDAGQWTGRGRRPEFRRPHPERMGPTPAGPGRRSVRRGRTTGLRTQRGRTTGTAAWPTSAPARRRAPPGPSALASSRCRSLAVIPPSHSPRASSGSPSGVRPRRTGTAFHGRPALVGISPRSHDDATCAPGLQRGGEERPLRGLWSVWGDRASKETTGRQHGERWTAMSDVLEEAVDEALGVSSKRWALLALAIAGGAVVALQRAARRRSSDPSLAPGGLDDGRTGPAHADVEHPTGGAESGNRLGPARVHARVADGRRRLAPSLERLHRRPHSRPAPMALRRCSSRRAGRLRPLPGPGPRWEEGGSPVATSPAHPARGRPPVQWPRRAGAMGEGA